MGNVLQFANLRFTGPRYPVAVASRPEQPPMTESLLTPPHLAAVSATGDRDTADIAGSRPHLVYVHHLAVLLNLDVAAPLLGEDPLRAGDRIRPARKDDDGLAAARYADGPAAAVGRADDALLLGDRGLAHGGRVPVRGESMHRPCPAAWPIRTREGPPMQGSTEARLTNVPHQAVARMFGDFSNSPRRAARMADPRSSPGGGRTAAGPGYRNTA